MLMLQAHRTHVAVLMYHKGATSWVPLRARAPLSVPFRHAGLGKLGCLGGMELTHSFPHGMMHILFFGARLVHVQRAACQCETDAMVWCAVCDHAGSQSCANCVSVEPCQAVRCNPGMCPSLAATGFFSDNEQHTITTGLTRASKQAHEQLITPRPSVAVQQQWAQPILYANLS